MTKIEQILVILILVTILGFVESKIEYSDKDLTALTKFKQKIPDVLSLRHKEDYFNSNEYLIKWIQDQKYDLVKAEEKFRKSIQWRKENKVDNIVNDPIIQSLITSLPYYDLGKDNEGRPAFGFSIGKWNIRKFGLAGKLDLVNKQFIHMFETTLGRIKNSWKQNPNITQWNLVTNYAGFNLREHFCLKCIPFYIELTTTFENYYPLHAKRIVVINAPRIFDNILQAVRPVISPETRKILQLFSVNKAEWQRYLHTFLDPRNLNLEYGGLKIQHTKSK